MLCNQKTYHTHILIKPTLHNIFLSFDCLFLHFNVQPAKASSGRWFPVSLVFLIFFVGLSWGLWSIKELRWGLLDGASWPMNRDAAAGIVIAASWIYQMVPDKERTEAISCRAISGLGRPLLLPTAPVYCMPLRTGDTHSQTTVQYACIWEAEWVLTQG